MDNAKKKYMSVDLFFKDEELFISHVMRKHMCVCIVPLISNSTFKNKKNNKDYNILSRVLMFSTVSHGK